MTMPLIFGRGAHGEPSMHTVDDGFQHGGYACLAFAVTVFGIPAGVFWPYFFGIVLLAIGLAVVIKNELPQAHGLDRVMPFGRLFYAVPMGVFAGEHFTSAKFIATLIPNWIPAHLFWAYFVGVALTAAALSIIVKRQAQLASTLLGIMILSFVILLHIPRVLANPRDRFAWAVALRDTAFSGGAFAFAVSESARTRSSMSGLVHVARFFIGIPAVFFGVEHFLHPEYVSGVPLDKLTPTWIPLRLEWAYLAGAVLIVAGLALIVNKKARLAASYLGIMIFVLVLFIYLPILAAQPSDIGNGLNYFVDTLLFSGTVLLLANALPKEVEHPV